MTKYMTNFDDLKIVNVRSDIAKLLHKMKAKTICEIGVRDGEHLQALLIKGITQAVAVDIWKDTGVVSQNDECSAQLALDEQYQIVLNMAEKDKRINVIKDFSVNASKQFPDEYFDFVYIDADHTEEAVKEDILAWWPKVRSGGVLAGHDYSPAIITFKDNYVLKFGVIEAVNKFVANNKLALHTDSDVPPGDRSWFIVKS